MHILYMLFPSAHSSTFSDKFGQIEVFDGIALEHKSMQKDAHNGTKTFCEKFISRFFFPYCLFHLTIFFSLRASCVAFHSNWARQKDFSLHYVCYVANLSQIILHKLPAFFGLNNSLVFGNSNILHNCPYMKFCMQRAIQYDENDCEAHTHTKKTDSIAEKSSNFLDDWSDETAKFALLLQWKRSRIDINCAK